MTFQIVLVSFFLAFCTPVYAWTLTFFDDFDIFNKSIWSPADNFTHSSYNLTKGCELQLYTKNNVYVQNGNLVLRTKYDPDSAAAYGHNSRNYTSGWVESSSKNYLHPDTVGFSQTFGRWEIRAKLPDPSFPQIWPALWMMPEKEDTVPPNLCWPAGGEIDIMEMWGGRNYNRSESNFHWTKNGGKEPTKCGSANDLSHGPLGFYPKTGTTPIDWSKDFHIWAFEWTQNTISFYVDEVMIGSADQTKILVPQTPFYMIFNTAICGASWCHMTDPQPQTTVYHYIDWVKIYK